MLRALTRAHRGGADRLELCGNLGLGGGTTPSLGLFKEVRAAIPRTPIMVWPVCHCGDLGTVTSVAERCRSWSAREPATFYTPTPSCG